MFFTQLLLLSIHSIYQNNHQATSSGVIQKSCDDTVSLCRIKKEIAAFIAIIGDHPYITRAKGLNGWVGSNFLLPMFSSFYACLGLVSQKKSKNVLT